jgi:predicted ribosome quality control (RQC) complex YloA/Tae2 family protein
MAVGLDALGLTFLVRELEERLRDHTVESVSLDDERVLRLVVGGERPGSLDLLHDPGLTLMCVGPAKKLKKKASRLPRFEDLIGGGSISAVEQVGLDRVVRISIAQDAETFNLYFELTPPFPNAFLTDAADVILANLFKAGMRTRRRTLRRGEAYVAPSTQGKIHPFDVDAQTLETLPWQSDPEILAKTVLGIGPFLSREISWRAAALESLPEALGELVGAYRRAECRPCSFIISPLVFKGPVRIGIAWYRPRAPWVGEVNPADSLNTAARTLLNVFVATADMERRRAAVIRTLTKEIRRWEAARARAREAQSKALGLRYRRFAEILIANLNKIRKGAQEVVLPDLYGDEGAEIVIPLEPRLTPQANAEVYFKKARKAQRRENLAEQRIQSTGSKLEELRHLIEETRQEGLGEKRLGEIEKTITTRAAAAGQRAEAVDEKAARLGIRPRRYVVTDDWTVLVGRSAKENDILSHRYATPSDLWFHARQAQGSHVVLKRGRKKTQVPRQAILEAAAIAAYYSKARTSKHVPVSYTERRYIKRVRKGPPGQCVMLREKVVFVDPGLPRRPSP